MTPPTARPTIHEHAALRSPRRLLAVLLAVAVAMLVPCVATAQDEPRAAPASRAASAQSSQQADLISAAERAERLGEYAFAIAAFEQAYAADPQPWLVDAIANARHRRLAATQDAAADAGAEPAIEIPPTRLAVLSSAMGAVARVDGKKARKLPLFTTIEPGNHTIDVSAPGYRKQVRKLNAVRGLVHALSADLEPEPAKLAVTGTGGAEVHVDGRFVGITPMEEPIDVTPGARLVAVTLNGYLPYTDKLHLRPGATKELEVDLSMTKRHVGASVMLALGGAGVLTGLVLGAASVVVDQSVADDPESADKQRAFARGDDYRAVSGMAAGVGLGVSLAGAILFTFDEPDLSVEPSGPGIGGATLRLRF